MSLPRPIPVIDIFAGPGGLGEGFSCCFDATGRRQFSVRLSIEKEPIAHRTLMLRALFRSFPVGRVPDCYYDYLRAEITREELLNRKSIRDQSFMAAHEAKLAELGRTPHKEVDLWISEALDGTSEWVLIGGPPCQAYSIAGRSRRRPVDPVGFANDKRHSLYTEYLRIIEEFHPSIFVMENVKGMLTSTHQGTPIFERILSDLSGLGNRVSYILRSFSVEGEGDKLRPEDFLIEAERYGIPQSRHRVILLGVRSDIAARLHKVGNETLGKFVLTRKNQTVSCASALSGLPKLRSRLSREPDSSESWLAAVASFAESLKEWRAAEARKRLIPSMVEAVKGAACLDTYGGPFVPNEPGSKPRMNQELLGWLLDPRLGGFIQHETRKHMRFDLHRYLFASCYAEEYKVSPKLGDFPPRLLPAHENIDHANVPFEDRFCVQLEMEPSRTIVSHISKDGHYYIHHDASQCRSLTVREAARLQTFPDNYFFEGTRTAQYVQVGNAVPPLLAKKIAEVVFEIIQAGRCSPLSRQLAPLLQSTA